MTKARQIATNLNKIMRSSVRKRGIAAADMPMRWHEIVPEYKEFSRPLKLFKGTLTIASSSASASHNMQMMGDFLIQRINGFFGYAAVKKLRFEIHNFTDAQKPVRITPLEISLEAQQKAQKLCKTVADNNLKQHLIGLGAAIIQENINKKEKQKT